MDERRYSEDEVQEILRRASGTIQGGYTQDDLVRMAEELGLTPDAIERAKQDLEVDRVRLDEKKKDQEFLAEYTQSKRYDVRVHWISFIAVNLFLIGIWFVTDRGYFWPMWPMMGWGLGVAIHTGVALSHDEREFQSWKRRKLKKLKKLESGIEEDDLEEVVPFRPSVTVGIHVTNKPKPITGSVSPEAEEVRMKIAEYKKMGYNAPPERTDPNRLGG